MPGAISRGTSCARPAVSFAVLFADTIRIRLWLSQAIPSSIHFRSLMATICDPGSKTHSVGAAASAMRLLWVMPWRLAFLCVFFFFLFWWFVFFPPVPLYRRYFLKVVESVD